MNAIILPAERVNLPQKGRIKEGADDFDVGGVVLRVALGQGGAGCRHDGLLQC